MAIRDRPTKSCTKVLARPGGEGGRGAARAYSCTAYRAALCCDNTSQSERWPRVPVGILRLAHITVLVCVFVFAINVFLFGLNLETTSVMHSKLQIPIVNLSIAQN